MNTDRPYQPDLANVAKGAFRKANPERYGKVQGRPEAVSQLRTIDMRAGQMRARMRQHFVRYQEAWVAKEAIRVWQKRAALTAKHPPPFNYMRESLTARSIMQEARRNVRARMTGRLTRLNRIETQMQNAVVRSQQFRDRDMTLAQRPGSSPARTRRYKRKQQ